MHNVACLFKLFSVAVGGGAEAPQLTLACNILSIHRHHVDGLLLVDLEDDVYQLERDLEMDEERMKKMKEERQGLEVQLSDVEQKLEEATSTHVKTSAEKDEQIEKVRTTLS